MHAVRELSKRRRKFSSAGEKKITSTDQRPSYEASVAALWHFIQPECSFSVLKTDLYRSHMLVQINPVHSPFTPFLQIHFNITSHLQLDFLYGQFSKHKPICVYLSHGTFPLPTDREYRFSVLLCYNELIRDYTVFPTPQTISCWKYSCHRTHRRHHKSSPSDNALWQFNPVYIFMTYDHLTRLATGWTVRGSNPEETRFSAPVQTGPEAQPASYTMGTGSFPGVKRPGRRVDHPPPSSAEVKKE
jgi:hypothetical protein